MRRTRNVRQGGTGKTLLYSFVLVIVCSLLGTGLPASSAQDGTGRKTRDGDAQRAGNGSILSASAPTQVRLNKFEAYSFNRYVSLEWQSGYELDNLGYNVYQELNGERIQLNPSLIAGSALQAGQGVALTAGYGYAWRAKLLSGKQALASRYWLESVDLNGQSRWYGPIQAQADDMRAVHPAPSKLLEEYAVSDEAAVQREWPATLSGADDRGQLSFITPTITSRAQASPELDQQWALAAQVCVKLSVNREGWQRVTRAELLAAGLAQGASLANLQLFVGGVEQAMVVNADGSIEFYGQALDTRDTDTRVYWLVAGATPGKRVTSSSAGPFNPNVPAASFASTIERKDKVSRFPALLNGAEQNFFGPSINSSLPLRQTLQVSALDQASATQAQLEVKVQGLTIQEHQVNVQVNGVNVGVINYSYRDNAIGQFNISPTLLRENKNTITLLSMLPGSDVSLIEYVRLTYPRLYRASSNRLQFSVPGGQAARIEGFTSSAIRVLDITDTANITELTVSPQASGGAFAFTLPAAASTRTLLALVPASFEHPVGAVRNEPSSWNQTTNAANMVILTYKDFRQSLEPLRALRQSQGLTVTIVDVEDVYDEFSFGAHSAQALRDFMQRAKDQWQTTPGYLLLVGDATSDPRNYFGLGELDLVPTGMIDSDFSESASDDALVDFDNDSLTEIAVGRFPVKTALETTRIINKIMTYEQANAGDTQQRGAVMVSDHFDIYDFEFFTSQVLTSVPAMMNVQLINRDEADTATTRALIQAAINQGPGVVNYLGHGSVGVWTGAGLLTTADAPNLANNQRLSLFVMMTCLNGSFTELNTESLAESLLEGTNGGAVGVWASSGLTVPYGQVAVSKKFYELLFTGQVQRLGDAAKGAKSATPDRDVRRMSIFFGDPAMRFR